MILLTQTDARSIPTKHHDVSTSSETEVRLFWRARIRGLQDPAGPRLQLHGWVVLTGSYARLRIQPPGARIDASRERTKLIPIVSAGRTIPALPGRSEWPIPAHSRLALRACDFAGHPLGPERDAGVCREGAIEGEITVPLAVLLWVRLSVRVDERPLAADGGLVLTSSGELTIMSGLLLRLELWPIGDEAGLAPSAIEWPVVQPGRRLFGREREVAGIDSGSWLLVRFIRERGDAIDEERIVGRGVLQ